MNVLTIFLVLLLMLLAACVKPLQPDKRYGLELTSYKVDIARQAVSNINTLLTSANQQSFYLFNGALKKKGVAVLWVGNKNLSQSATDMMFVLEGCACVVVQPRVFVAWLNNYQTVAGKLEEDVDDQINVLSYLLLHELGHIVQGDTGRAASIDTKNFNRDLGLEKIKEKNADDYASRLLLGHLQNKDDFVTWMPAANIQMSLGSLAFDLQGKRIIDNFACSILDAPCAFHDMGDTHENFEYRVLQANCRLAPDIACQSLEDYKRRRLSDGFFDLGPLYQKNSSEY